MVEYWKNLDLRDLFYINDDGLVCCEEWRDIPEYEGYYKASNLGRIKSLERMVISGKGFKLKKENMLKQTECFYLKVSLCVNGKQDDFCSHILIAKTFLDVKNKNNYFVDHIVEQNTYNNTIGNLQILTPRRNTIKNFTHRGFDVGVSFKSNKWIARISIKQKTFSLGAFNFKKDAKKAYLTALKRIENNENIDDLVKKRSSSTGYYCVQKCKKKYVPHVTIDGKRIRLGVFSTAKEASDYRDIYISENGLL